MHPGDIIQVKIVDITSSGSGVGRTSDNAVVFVPGAIPGETLLARILEARKNLFIGEIAELPNRPPRESSRLARSTEMPRLLASTFNL